MRSGALVAGIVAVGLSSSAYAQWVRFAEDAGRLSAPAELGSGDTEEKDFAWGDLDQDGDDDLVVVRKEPFTSPGRRVNLLLMNEGGVLVDRTVEFASASDVKGDQGFLTATNDRDVVLVDVDLDGWLDMVTAVTLTDNEAKHLSHPRVYMNLGDADGQWLGFQHQDARIPLLHETAGPRFCSVAAGDLTGDGWPDLYFGDYDSGGLQIFDFNNRLLVNDGTGHFADETDQRLTPQMAESAFGAASVIADMNNDGVSDVVKQTSLNSPLHVAVTYNDPSDVGHFDRYDLINENAPYFVSVGDLNQDGLLDVVVTDDGSDRFLLNQGNDGLGQAQFLATVLPESGGFGGNSVITDLNNDGHPDIVITDVDVDIVGCSRSTFLYRNLGNLPQVSFQMQGDPIPADQLQGVHDVAVIDLDQDGWLDLVLGRCTGTQVWMNQPPVGLVFSYPLGLPAFLPPGATSVLRMSIEAVGGGDPAPGTGRLYLSIDNGPFTQTAMTEIGPNLYEAELPALACPGQIDFYLEAELNTGTPYTDPPDAPVSVYTAIAAGGTTELLRDDVEGDVSGWTIEDDPSLTSGTWEAADPNGTLFNGQLAAPEDDATQGAESVRAFVTAAGVPGQGPGEADLDGGPTRLISPLIELGGTDATISYARWFVSDGGGTHVTDALLVDVSNDGGASWVPVPEHTTQGTGSEWETVSFVLSDYVAPTDQVRVRFSAGDEPNNSITEAGIDNFQVDVFDCPDEGPLGACCFDEGSCAEQTEAGCTGAGGAYQGDGSGCEAVACPAPCPADLDGSGSVDVDDLVALILAWGTCGKAKACPADLTGDGFVDVDDLVELILAWGECG